MLFGNSRGRLGRLPVGTEAGHYVPSKYHRRTLNLLFTFHFPLLSLNLKRVVPVRGYDTYCKPIFSAKFAFETALTIAI
jgi:hypothetical protein